MNETITVIGAKGMLGKELCRQLLLTEATVHRLDLPDLDITDTDAVLCCKELSGSNTIYNCAGYTDVDKAESEEKLATRINGLGVANLAQAAKKAGALLVNISTDYVFSGETDEPYPVDSDREPISAYGRSKLTGELALDISDYRFLNIRTAWLYGPGGNNFVETILKMAEEKETLSVVNDQTGSPTLTIDLVETIMQLVSSGAEGHFHCTNSGCCSWHEFAVEVVRLTGKETVVNPIGSIEAMELFNLAAERPEYSVLDMEETERLLGTKMRHWKDALAYYFSIRE